MVRTFLLRGCVLVASSCAAAVARSPVYDVVINGGFVVDPTQQINAVRDIGIRDGKVACVSSGHLEGKKSIDARGLVVAPGFIDLHQHGQTPENYELKARDGVTTALELEIGVADVRAWYSAREGRAVVNFGASAGHVPVRMQVFGDAGTFLPTGSAVVANPASPGQLKQVLDTLNRNLDEGALAIGLGIAYVPGATREEILRVFQLGARRHVPVFVHLRSAGPVEPGGIDALQEVLSDAAMTGASLHVVHLTSTELRQTPLALEMMRAASKHGQDVTTESYPYTAGMTDIGSAIFSPGWEQRNDGITFGDLQWAETGERLTAESFARYRKHGGMVAIHSIPENIVRLAMAAPDVLVASDGILSDGKGHPRAAGAFSRVLARYVREEHALSMSEAINKMSCLPAKRLGWAHKGNLQVGSDADITVFDPARVADHATFEKPDLPSTGIPFVLIDGVLVVNNGELIKGILPGRGIRR